MRQTPFCNQAARFLSLACLLSALALQSPVARSEGTPGTTPQPQTPADVVREMAPPAPNPQLGGRAARTQAREKANENVQKAEQERQQASNDAARNPNDASKQTKDFEAQQKLDQAVTDAAKLTDSVREANQQYQDAYKAADKAVNDPNTNLSDAGTKIRDLGEAKKNYDAKLEEEKAKSARANAPNWNRQRFAEQQAERQRQATQQGTPGTPQTQPGGATPGTGTGNIGQTQTPPTAAQMPNINVITDIASGAEEYNISVFTFGWSGTQLKGDWSKQILFEYPTPQVDAPPGGAKLAPVEFVRVCKVDMAGFYYIPGTDTCLKIGGTVRADLGNGVHFEFPADNNQYIGLRPREPLRLPLIGTEKNTETGFQDGPLRCFPSNGSCIIQVNPQQGGAYGVPPVIFIPGVSQVQVRYPNYQYGGSVANITGQSTFPLVQVPQGFQAGAYDFSVGDQTFRQFAYRGDKKPSLGLSIALKYINANLATSYPRTEDDPGRDKEPALDPGAAFAAGHTEKLPQARLDLRPPPARMRARR